MDKVAAIRHAVLVQGRSIRAVAREFGVGRRTIDRYIKGAEVGRRTTPPRPSPRRETTAAALTTLIAETKAAKKQQLTARRAHELLRSRGVDVGYTLVKELMAERRRAAKEVSVPLEYAAGDLGEVDFFEVVVVIAGVEETMWMFVMRLMSSGRDFCRVYPRQDQVCFLDGHVRAFEAFGGVPTRCAYDNLKAAVAKILVGSERKLAARFEEMTKHCVLEPCFARPYHGNDKGGVEARGKNIRLQSMVPLPSAATLDEVNAQLATDVDRRFFARSDATTKWEAELAAMHPLPWGPFDARRMTTDVPVSSCSTVQIDGSTYSVPTTWARRRVTTYAGVDVVEMRLGEESIVRRRVPRGQRDIDYASHYLSELSKKPQAVRQVADTLVKQLGGRFPEFWERLVNDKGAREAARRMARILRGVLELGRDECERRVGAALTTGESISAALLVPQVENSVQALVPSVLDVFVETSSVSAFDALLSPGGVQ
ncbi:MAG: IS21 family transposase [Myxococcaceae bacterium]